jgi:hypothetical protein
VTRCARGLQTMQAEAPKSFCAEEYQELLRIAMIPDFHGLVKSQFQKGKAAKRHAEMEADLDWEEGMGPAYMFSCDYDSRHTFNSARNWADPSKGWKDLKERDRLLLERDVAGWVQMYQRQWVPSAPRCQDSLQSPVENIIRVIQVHAYKKMAEFPDPNWADLEECLRHGVAAVTQEKVENSWKHMIKVLSPFAGLRGTTQVVVTTATGKKEVDCVGGGQLPKKLRA